MPFQILQIDELQRRFVRCFQHDSRRGIGLKGFLPAGGAQAPLVAVLEAGKSELRARRAQVVAAAFGKFEKLVCHFRADDVHSSITRAGAAAAVPMPAGERIERAGNENGADDVAGFDGHAGNLPHIATGPNEDFH